MRPRPVRSARARIAVLFASTFVLLGGIVVAITYGLATRGSTIAVTSVVPAAGGGLTVALASPTPLGATQTTASPRLRRFRVSPSRIAASLVAHQHSADTRRLLAVSGLGLALTALIAGGLGWLVAGRVLRPVRAITDKARTITAGNLGERLELSGPDDEFRRLGDSFDDLLSRLETSFEAQRRFVANASHELRTPLTFDRTLLQVALADPDASAGTLRAACEELLGSGREQERLIDALLTLATSEQVIAQHESIDLAAVAARVTAAASEAGDRLGVTIKTSLEPAIARGDEALVERLVANLVDNAVSHNVAGGRVEVRTSSEEGAGLLVVANTGMMISPSEIASLFEPFRRLAATRPAQADGHHGLGLSIVRAIASSHGATVTAVPRPEGGLELTARFPRA